MLGMETGMDSVTIVAIEPGPITYKIIMGNIL